MRTPRLVRAGAEAFGALVERMAPRFARAEPRRRAAAYLRGLLAPIERKNGWPVADAVGDRTPDGVQDVLARVHWDADRGRDDLRADAVAPLGDAEAGLVVDETGFVTTGSTSVGVPRPSSGPAGRIETGQIGGVLGTASPHGQALIDRALSRAPAATPAR